MTKAEERTNEVISSYKTTTLRNSDIPGYSKYAMENAVMQAYLLGRKDERDYFKEQYEEQFKENTNENTN